MTELSRAEMQAKVGQKLGSSNWYTVDQTMIDTFANVTFDHQYIHVDPERAAKTPFGGTIAHGFLTLSLLSTMLYEGVPTIKGTTMGVNYGFDRVRFISPVPVGSRVRAHFTLADFKDIRACEIQTTMSVSVEIEGQDKPALVAEWLGRLYMGEDA